MRFDGIRRLVRPVPRSSGGVAADIADLDTFIRALRDLIERMDRNQPGSFVNSFIGEFDVREPTNYPLFDYDFILTQASTVQNLQRIDRDAVRNMHSEFDTSINPDNALKNRYPNILCNETSRVKLQDVGVGENDYVNANSISGFGSHPGYIATQAPLPATMAQFWQMVYEDNCPVIVMLTREQETQCYYPKCNRYWPAPNECILFGRYYVYGLGEQTDQLLGVIRRKFRVGKIRHQNVDSPPTNQWNNATAPDSFQTPVRRTPRNVGAETVPIGDDDEPVLEPDGEPVVLTQIQYIDWPDQGVPEHPKTLLKICDMVDELCDAQKDGSRPPGRPVIHCSAGVGRTGTFISVHKLLRAVAKAFPGTESRGSGGVPLVEEVVAGLKRERSKMVQTAEQYRFIFVALAEGVMQFREKLSERVRQ